MGWTLTQNASAVFEPWIKSDDGGARFATSCAWCKCIRTKENLWVPEPEVILSSLVKKTHTICPDCRDKVINDFKRSEGMD